MIESAPKIAAGNRTKNGEESPARPTVCPTIQTNGAFEIASHIGVPFRRISRAPTATNASSSNNECVPSATSRTTNARASASHSQSELARIIVTRCALLIVVNVERTSSFADYTLDAAGIRGAHARCGDRLALCRTFERQLPTPVASKASVVQRSSHLLQRLFSDRL